LNSSLEKLKLELLSTKKAHSKVEADRFEMETEMSRVKHELKQTQSSFNAIKEEKEHLMQLVEMKQQALQGENMDVYEALQKVSALIIKKDGEIDDHT